MEIKLIRNVPNKSYLKIILEVLATIFMLYTFIVNLKSSYIYLFVSGILTLGFGYMAIKRISNWNGYEQKESTYLNVDDYKVLK